MLNQGKIEAITTSLLTALKLKDESTYRHSKKVMFYSLMIGKEMGLGQRDLEVLKWAALLHDIGKLLLPDELLTYQGKLHGKALALMKSHQTLGVKILQQIDDVQELLPVIEHHHEWYNGKGYPEGIAGEDIPLLARVLAVADAYEAMTRVRDYNTPFSHLQACSELRRKAGIQFDPDVVDAFLKGAEEGRPLVSILVVENDVKHLMLLLRFVTEMGFAKFGRVSKPDVATRIVQSNGYDLVLSDFSSPWGNGFEVVRLVKREAPDVKVAIMYPSKDKRVREIAKEMGIYACLEKPVERREIFDIADKIAVEKINY